MSKRAVVFIFLCLLLFLTGCWNSIELNEVIMVMGAGVDLAEEGYELSVEILKSTGGPGAEEADNEGMVISTKGKSFLDCARSMIRKTKRLLFFSHTNIWVISEELARQNFTEVMDTLRRDQMPRLNSLLLITPERPKDILSTTTIAENLTSVDTAESMLSTEFTSQFQTMEIRRAFEMLSSAVPTTFIPIIQTNQQDEEVITELAGVALIKNDQMIGKLNIQETKALLYLRGEAGSGTATTEINPGQKVSLEIHGQDVHIEPTLHGEQLTVDVDLEIRGTLSSIPPEMEVNEQTIRRIEESLTREGQEGCTMILKKLQQELKTDIVDFGLHVYRKYPQEWQRLKYNWDEIFANAEVNLHITTFVVHRGLLDQSRGEIYKKPQFIPFYFLDEEA